LVKLIVGLGNIGVHFEGSRHNTGFDVLDEFAASSSMVWQTKDKFKATVAEATLDDQKVLLLKPNTYYNLSGDAVRATADFYKLANSDILIVHDELALPFGTIRTRDDGSDAGNNGVKSIIAAIGNDFARIRVGIANEHLQGQDAADFVLGQLTRDEREKLPEIKKEAVSLINSFIQQGRLPNTSWHAS
jgi:PTH1 family peptidyl-tRNA hydrolase